MFLPLNNTVPTKNQNSAGSSLGSGWVLHRKGVVSTVTSVAESHLQLGACLVGLNVSSSGNLCLILLPGYGGEWDTFDGSHECDVSADHGPHFSSH